jgi:nicotinamidase-related amidase
MAAHVRKLLAAARERQVLTVFIRATYDREVTSAPLAQHRRRLGLVNSLRLEGSWGAQWYGGVEPIGAPHEVVVTKHRFDAFQGTPLDLYLRSNGIRSVIICGVVTSGCIESTVRDAFFQNYYVIVPRDTVADKTPSHHEAGLASIGRSFALLTDVDAVVEAWRGRNASSAPGWTTAAKAVRAAEDARYPALVLMGFTTDRARALADAGTPAGFLLAAARRLGVPVFHVHDAGGALSAARPAGADAADMSSVDWIPAFAPMGRELVVERLRQSAFADSRLALLLRTNAVRQMCVVGAPAFGAIDATVYDALDQDYAVAVDPVAVGGAAPDAMAAWNEAMRGAGVALQSAEEIVAGWEAASLAKPVAA